MNDKNWLNIIASGQVKPAQGGTQEYVPRTSLGFIIWLIIWYRTDHIHTIYNSWMMKIATNIIASGQIKPAQGGTQEYIPRPGDRVLTVGFGNATVEVIEEADENGKVSHEYNLYIIMTRLCVKYTILLYTC